MALDTRPPSNKAPVRRTGASREPERDAGRPARSLVVALVLASAALMVVDKAGGDSSPVDPVRRVVGEVVGPVQAGVSAVVRPVVDLPGAVRTNASLRGDVKQLEAENADLRNQLAKAGYDDQRLAELEGLRAVAGDLGYALLPARVIAIGPAQSFSSTVTLDAGSDAGLHPDMTVVAAEGLVGRITSVTAHTATVLLIVDDTSSVGGRIGENMELGFVRGHGSLGTDDRLEMELADRNVVPKVGQQIVTWGSEGGSPYVAGVPIGTVGKVYESLRETSYRAVITPGVDFTALDLVGVVVPSGTRGRVIEADGSLR
ncbi:rod shape-determining protein MreC [Nocardioides daeguensis]|uniref:Cell shape-determining protein MreC n=1 Tax=Nocardioides daeguensis TaxID=908359 RepID=A0ABP6WIM4_9ACTN|nr:rod shape-determining protein MreC [Nocardioides daeguensis]MBV6729057.1 rod shape-determining protein MreC [Nocardioides daeguensis]MCR1774939.1 rod shape-determining protein MreC [Nocardioides daeguensis]